jgi:hypothetical protein
VNIVIIQLYTSEIKDYAIINSQNTINYCFNHGYSYHSYNKSLNETRPAAWSKILAIKEQLCNYDWVLWLDSDARIMNHDIKIENLIDNKYCFIFPKENEIFNSGIFLIKNCIESIFWLNCIWETDNGKYTPDWWENASMINLYDTSEMFRKVVKLIDKRLINSYLNEYKKGDFIIHLAGHGHDARVNYFNSL